MARGSDGCPSIGLSVGFSGLRAVKCSNAAGTLETTMVVDPGNLGFSDHALTQPADGNPLIAIFDANNGDLKVARSHARGGAHRGGNSAR